MFIDMVYFKVFPNPTGYAGYLLVFISVVGLAASEKIQSWINTQPGYYELDQLSVSNNAKMSGLDTIDEQKNDNSDFEGYFKIT